MIIESMVKIMIVIEEFTELRTLETLLKKTGFDVLGLSKEIGVTESLLGFIPEFLIISSKGKSIDTEKVIVKVKKASPHCRVALVATFQAAATLTPKMQQMADAVIDSPIDPVRVLQTMATLARLDAQVLMDKYQKLIAPKKSDNNDTRVKGNQGIKPGDERTVVRGAKTADSQAPVSGSANDNTLPFPRAIGGTDSLPSNATSVTGIEIPHEIPTPASALAAGRKLGEILVEHVERERRARYEKFLQSVAREPVDKVIPHSAFTAAQLQAAKMSIEEKAEIEIVNESKRDFVKALFTNKK